MVDLDSTVDEVKKQIREAEDPDYSKLLEEEKEGKDRKTIKAFLEQRIENSEEEVQEEVEEELVEEIEEETEGGMLSGFSGPQLLAGGALLGLVIGLVVGAAALPMNQGISTEQAEQRVTTLMTAGQLSEEQISIETQARNSMYYMNVTATIQTPNGTRTRSQGYYMTKDGSLLFPEAISSPFGGTRNVVIDVSQALQRVQQPRQPTNETQTSGNTSQ